MKWNEERIQTLKERYAKDGPAKLAAEFGTTPYAVTAKARRLGVGLTRKKPPKDFQWTEPMLRTMRDRYETDGGQVLAAEFGLSLHTVRHKAHELGLKTKAGHVAWGKIRAERSESCDGDYFRTWSPDMAYVLGFLFADGSILKDDNGIAVYIATRDEAVLEFIKDSLKARGKIYRYEGKTDARSGRTYRPTSMLTIGSRKLAASLIALGLKRRKTYNDDPFPAVPDAFMADFVRGYLDGDGCVSVSKTGCSLSFVGSPRFVQGLRDALVRMANVRANACCLQTGKRTGTVWCQVRWYASDMKRLHAFLYYDGHGFCFARKKDKLTAWLAGERRGRNSSHNHPEGSDA